MKIINNLSGNTDTAKNRPKAAAMDTGYDPTIRRVELGECCPSAEFMFDMSDYFGVPIEEIFAPDKSTESVQRGKIKMSDAEGQRFKPDK